MKSLFTLPTSSLGEHGFGRLSKSSFGRGKRNMDILTIHDEQREKNGDISHPRLDEGTVMREYSQIGVRQNDSLDCVAL